MTLILTTALIIGWLHAMLWLGREIQKGYTPPYLFHVKRSQKPYKR